MTSYGYIIMIIVDSCIICFHLDCIIQLKESYYIATNVSSRKSATNFGDLPDCWVNNRKACDLRCHRAHYDVIVMVINTSIVVGCTYSSMPSGLNKSPSRSEDIQVITSYTFVSIWVISNAPLSIMFELISINKGGPWLTKVIICDFVMNEFHGLCRPFMVCIISA